MSLTFCLPGTQQQWRTCTYCVQQQDFQRAWQPGIEPAYRGSAAFSRSPADVRAGVFRAPLFFLLHHPVALVTRFRENDDRAARRKWKTHSSWLPLKKFFFDSLVQWKLVSSKCIMLCIQFPFHPVVVWREADANWQWELYGCAQCYKKILEAMRLDWHSEWFKLLK